MILKRLTSQAFLKNFFKNTEVSREDISPLMRDFAEKTKCLPQPRKMLIGSYFAKKIFLITPLVKWYLEQGLVAVV